ncbi:MAG: SGNH/GDSL hydrolase family protein [Gemmatimonadaceae bacterium]
MTPPAGIAPRYLALGDSYTIGEGVTADARWPSQLVAALRARGLAVADPELVARSGWTCDELSHGIDAAMPAGRFALVSLLIGVNDQYRGASAAEYASRFAPLLARAVALAGGHAERVMVVSLPDWGVTPFAAGRDRAAIATAIDAFNAVNRAAASRAGARYVDVTLSSRRAAGDETRLTSDGLHPSAAMYADWVRLVLPPAATIVGQ